MRIGDKKPEKLYQMLCNLSRNLALLCKGHTRKIWGVLLSPIFPLNLLVLLDTLQLAAGATGLYSQGVTAVVHGCSICALGQL